MSNKLRRIFAPTPEEELEDLEKYKRFSERAYQEKSCSTCVEYIPVPDDLPGVVSAYPDCKRGGLAIKTCLFYNVDENKRKSDEAFFADWMATIQEHMRKEHDHE